MLFRQIPPDEGEAHMRSTITGRHRSAIRVGLILAATVVAALSVWVAGVHAVFPDSDVPTYTGCLSTGGSGLIVSVAAGDAPAQPCNSNQTLVHVSGGDITNIETSGGSGLRGGTDNGKASLRLDNTGCANGGVLQWNAVAGVWECGTFTGTDFAVSNQSCSVGDFVTGIDASGALTCAPESDDDVFYKSCNCYDTSPLEISGADGDQVISLDVPAGSYFVTAKMHVYNPEEEPTSQLVCSLSTGDSVGVWLSANDLLINFQTIVLQDAATFDTASQITVFCDPWESHTTLLWGISISAVRVSGINIQ
jgi:hypothetical protein